MMQFRLARRRNPLHSVEQHDLNRLEQQIVTYLLLNTYERAALWIGPVQYIGTIPA
jgi:hypothetical protein